MGKKKMTILAVVAALIFVFAIFISFYFSSMFGINDPISLPSEPPASSDLTHVSGFPNSTPTPSPPVIKIEVSADNVQTVLSTLARPDAYSMRIHVETFWSGGSGTETRAVWVKNNYSKIELLTFAGFPAEHAIITPDKVYSWLQGSALPYEGNIGSFTADSKLRIPTYEKILSLSKEDIEAADCVLINGIQCVYVKLKPNNLSYSDEFWIDINNGLLYKSETTKNGSLIYRMTADNVNSDIPSDDKFKLPNGQLVIP